MYDALRPLLFRLSPETAHDLTLDWLGAMERLHLMSLLADKVPDRPVNAFGLTFKNRVGLAAGLDKNGDFIDAFGALGFGHVEVGTVTPRPQPGNPKPRMFRLPEQQGIINRMGFNNKGVDHMVRNLKKRQFKGIVGVNIGKNADTPVERAADDYLLCLQAVYPYADYVTVNLSSPNTPGLRTLQFGDALKALLTKLVTARNEMHQASHRQVPLLVKIAPDMTDEETREVASVLVSVGIDGVIATNTTVDRSQVAGSPWAHESGGLSGAPLASASTHTLRTLSYALDGAMPIMGVGGIMDGASAKQKVAAGATLVQLYTGLIYRGPAMIREVQAAIL